MQVIQNQQGSRSTQILGIMSEYKDADVQVMGIFLLSLKRGQNKDEEDYISWLLQEHSLQNTFRDN